jgi:hypothetical protein
MADVVPVDQIGPGTIVEWQGVPVAVLSDPWTIDYGSASEKVRARAVYLARPSGGGQAERGWVCKEFCVTGKTLWPYPLSDEDEAFVMRMILT